MARVRDVDANELAGETRAVFDRFVAYGPFLNQARVFAHRPPALRHMMAMLMELSDEALVPKRYLEIAVVTVSKLNECAYCVAHHAPQAVDQGLSTQTVDRILDDDCPGLDDVDRLVRDYAVQVTQRPQYMRDAIFDRLHEHFTDAQIVELTLRTALCGFFNRFNDSLQIAMEDDATERLLAAGFTEGANPTAA